MQDFAELLQKLQSKDRNARYEACEELRVAPSIPPEALAALRAASTDADPEVADAARRAIALHEAPPSPAMPASRPEPHVPMDTDAPESRSHLLPLGSEPSLKALEAKETLTPSRQIVRGATALPFIAAFAYALRVRGRTDLAWLAVGLSLLLVGIILWLQWNRIRALSSQRPADLRLDPQGIHDARQNVSIPWSELTSFRCWKDPDASRGAAVFFVGLKHPKAFRSGIPTGSRLLTWPTRVIYGCDIVIDTTFLDVSADEIKTVADEHLRSRGIYFTDV